ncbi:hypothetical protein SAMN04488018_12213 [Myroides marinus]|uniref:Uncharacterized protein n=1 Tax=Myroides marinus TaxID=703342 RepID=A0A1H6XQV7_9FLAO|nr:hypothetical protein [Myroides marinus]SEJ29147.1 hypothetical protein SAMN04488018_12213 [Myroides marinus]
MKDTHILIFEHDIVKYPPILSFISFLFQENKKIVLIGYCSDEYFIRDFIDNGGVYYNVIDNKLEDNIVKKMFRYLLFKKRVKGIVKEFDEKYCRIYFFGEKCAWLLYTIVSNYSSVIYLFETPTFVVELKYRLLSPMLNYKEVLQRAYKVVCCEYNRAHITKSYFSLKELPIIIPNKPIVKSVEKKDISELEDLVDKKVILYQGIFNYPERKLDEFCLAMEYLPEDYVLCLMGGDNKYKAILKSKYSSDRIRFLNYVTPPMHLQITEMAYIGILVYNSGGNNISETLNTLYCAPNKIYEYSKFSIPMISNDVPALDFLFKKFKCGEISCDEAQSIASKILEIDKFYSNYSKGSTLLYNSVDLRELYFKIS